MCTHTHTHTHTRYGPDTVPTSHAYRRNACTLQGPEIWQGRAPEDGLHPRTRALYVHACGFLQRLYLYQCSCKSISVLVGPISVRFVAQRVSRNLRLPTSPRWHGQFGACARSFSVAPSVPFPTPPSPLLCHPPPLALSARLLLLFATERRVRRQRSGAPDDDGLFDALLDAQLHRATRIHVHFFTSRSRTRRSPMPETPAPFALNWYCVSVPFGICFRVLLPLQRRSVNGPAGAERHERCRSTGMTSTILVDWDSYDHV